MKKNYISGITIILILNALLTIYPVYSQIPEIAWEKQYDLPSSNYFSDLLELPDGKLLVLGAKEMPSQNDFDIWLLECDAKGDTIRTFVFGNPGKDVPMKIIPLGSKGFMIASISVSGVNEYFSRLMCINPDFSQNWVTQAEKPSALIRTDITADNDENIWWLNTFVSQNGPEVTLFKIDAAGTKTDEFTIKNEQPSFAYVIRSLPDGNLAIACQIKPEKGTPYISIIKAGLNGQESWRSDISISDKALTPQCICCSQDNSLLAGGHAGICYNIDSPPDEQIWDYDYLLAKLAPEGKIIWTQQYSREGSEKGTAIAALPDGKIMAAGKCETSFTGAVGPWLLLIDKDGKLIKDKVYKFKFINDQVSRIVCTPDNGFLVIGPGYIDSPRPTSGWIMKLNPIQ